MMLFSDFHWPTFFVALLVFFLAVNLWNVVKYSLLKNRAEARVKKADAELQELLKKLKKDNQKISDLIAKMKQPKS
jgi:cell division protein FtsB